MFLVALRFRRSWPPLSLPFAPGAGQVSLPGRPAARPPFPGASAARAAARRGGLAGVAGLAAATLLALEAPQAAVVYQNDFGGADALADFQVLDTGAGVAVVAGKLRIDPGASRADRGVAALSVPAVAPAYPARFDAAGGTLSWSFTVANQNGEFSPGSPANNLFGFHLWSAADSEADNGYGYHLQGGGYVGDRMLFSRQYLSSTPGVGDYEVLMDIENGLGTLPAIGAFRLTYAPASGNWSLYFEQSTSGPDPLATGTRVGFAHDRVYTATDLPYVLFTSETRGSAFFDDLTIQQLHPVPLPPALLLLGSALLVLPAAARSRKRGREKGDGGIQS